MKKTTEKKVKAAVKACCDEDWSKKREWRCADHGCGGVAYFLGFLGAATHYIGAATGFWVGVLGFLKACIWPFFLVLELLKFLGA